MACCRVLVPALILLCVVAAGPGVAQDEAEAELEIVRERIEALERRIADETRQRDDGAAELRRLELAIVEATDAIAGLAEDIDAQAARETELLREAGIARTRLGVERDLLAEQVRLSFNTGRQEVFRLLLSQESPADLGRMLTYYDYLNEARSRRIGTATAELAELGRLTAAARGAREELDRLRETRTAELARIDTARRERAEFVERMRASIAGSGSEIERLRADETRLAELVAELATLLEGFPTESEAPFASWRGRLSWPLDGELTADFGDPREGGALRWNGVVLDAGEGTYVRAIYHGRVAFADWLPGLGLLVIVDHGEQYMSLYGHNRALLREQGDWVQPGEAIAEVGVTGGRRSPALYFEIRRGSEPENPHDWIR